MSVFTCPKCGHHTHVFGEDGGRRVAEEIGVEVLGGWLAPRVTTLMCFHGYTSGDIPLDVTIRQTSDSGHPVVISHPQSPQASSSSTPRKFYADMFLTAGRGIQINSQSSA